MLLTETVGDVGDDTSGVTISESGSTMNEEKSCEFTIVMYNI